MEIIMLSAGLLFLIALLFLVVMLAIRRIRDSRRKLEKLLGDGSKTQKIVIDQDGGK